MPRRPRVFVEGAVHHVYNRFARGEAVFAGEGEAGRYVRLLREVKERDGFSLLAWCLLSNHYHLVVRGGPVSLSRSMRSLQGRFSQAFNIRHQRTGPVWQSRFHARPVVEEGYLRRLILYVHANPVRAGLAEDPATYRWCGHADLIGRRRGTLVDVDDALEVFGPTRRRARRQYVSSLEAELAGAERELPVLTPPPSSGDRELARRRDVARVDEQGVSTGPERPTVDADGFVATCAGILGVEVGDLGSRRRSPELVRARELIATLGLQRWRQRAKELARPLGFHPDSVSRLASRGSRRAVDDPTFRRDLDALDRRMIELGEETQR